MNVISYGIEEWSRLVSSGGDAPDIPIWLQVNGRSMLPFIRPGRDTVLLMPVRPDELQVGDIVLFPCGGSRPICCLHRIYKLDGDRAQTFGDGNLRPDGWIPQQSVLGKAVMIRRGKRDIRCDDPRWVRRFRLWCSLLCIRPFFLFSLRVLRRIKKLFTKKPSPPDGAE